jgi:sphingomyelin phosphodiesterase acid-like 3
MNVSRAIVEKCILVCCSSMLLGGILSTGATAQGSSSLTAKHSKVATKVASPAAETMPALFLSDIHFEPFWDPDKVQQLVAAPVSQWKTILAAPPSSDQQQRFASLQQSCHVRGDDASYALLASSLHAMQSHAGGAKFVTVSGDLIAHAFSCKYTALFPHSAPNEYKAFVEKTLDFVMQELHSSFQGVPVYMAMGNNDSNCGDYQLNAHSEFLTSVGKSVTEGFSSSEHQTALQTFADGGYYSVSLPAPMQHTRLLVINDIFMARNYTACSGKPDPSAATAQLTWLEQQLTKARQSGEKIWVMGHIPPGIDPYSTARKMTDVCHNQKPQMFLSSEKLADMLVEFGDVVRLAIFAHTHMDELRLLQSAKDGDHTGSQKSVAVKMVSSISPVDGNNPSFTVARIDPSSAMLEDYEVFAASNQTGTDTAWNKEYDYAQAYHQGSFSASSLKKLVTEFQLDPSAKSEASQSYLRNYFVGDRSMVLKPFWPEYVCSLSNYTADTFRSCMCSNAR